MEKRNIQAAYLRVDTVQAIQANTPPRCFYCGYAYIKDIKHCKEQFSVWMPGCDCLNKPTVRLVTGGEIEMDEE